MSIIKKAYAISDAKIQFVSLVGKAANKRKFIITKSETEPDKAQFTSEGRIIKEGRREGGSGGYSIDR